MALLEGQEPLISQVARIDERVHALVDDIRELKEAQKLHREESSQTLKEISEKIDSQNTTIIQYKRDRSWIVGIFTSLYGILVVWIQSKMGK